MSDAKPPLTGRKLTIADLRPVRELPSPANGKSSRDRRRAR